MTGSDEDGRFGAKLHELLGLTKGLGMAKVMLLRRLTLADPALTDPTSPKRLPPERLDSIFVTVLTRTLDRMDSADIAHARDLGFVPMLPDGPVDDAERALLAQLCASRMLRWDAAQHYPLDAAQVQAFDDAVAARCRRVLDVLAADTTPVGVPVPLVLSPDFAAAYDHLLRQTILPAMRTRAALRQAVAHMDLDEDFIHDPVFADHWRQAWDDHHDAAATVFSNLADPVVAPSFVFPAMADCAQIPALDHDLICECWREIRSTYEQEFQPRGTAEPARTGPFRDSIAQAMDRLGEGAGEWVAIRAYLDCPRMDKLILKHLIQSLGRSEAERQGRAPLLFAFFAALPR